MNTTRTEYEGRTYEVVTDETKRNEPLCIYAQATGSAKMASRADASPLSELFSPFCKPQRR